MRYVGVGARSADEEGIQRAMPKAELEKAFATCMVVRRNLSLRIFDIPQHGRWNALGRFVYPLLSNIELKKMLNQMSCRKGRSKSAKHC